MEFLEKKSTFSIISSGVDPFLREVFRGECSLVNSSGVRRKSQSSIGGGGEVRLLYAIAPVMNITCCAHKGHVGEVCVHIIVIIVSSSFASISLLFTGKSIFP